MRTILIAAAVTLAMAIGGSTALAEHGRSAYQPRHHHHHGHGGYYCPTPSYGYPSHYRYGYSSPYSYYRSPYSYYRSPYSYYGYGGVSVQGPRFRVSVGF